MSMPLRFLMPKPLLDQVLIHSEKEYPLECCGILAGTKSCLEGVKIWQVEGINMLENDLKSEREFRSSPESMFKAVKDLRKTGREMLAVYHSHPCSGPIPSGKDIEGNLDSEVFMFIVGNVKNRKDFALWEVASGGKVVSHKVEVQRT